jgi:hypothetical protein
MAICTIVGIAQSLQTNTPVKDKNYDLNYVSLSAKVDKERVRKGVYYLSQELLPRRVLNWSLPGHTLSTLVEADSWIVKQRCNLTKRTWKQIA